MSELMTHPIEREDPALVATCLNQYRGNDDFDIYTSTLHRRHYLKLLAGIALHDASEDAVDTAARAFDFASSVSELCGLDRQHIYIGDKAPQATETNDDDSTESFTNLITHIARDSQACVDANPQLQQLTIDFRSRIDPTNLQADRDLVTLVSALAAHINRGNQRVSIQRQINELELLSNQPPADDQ